MRRTAPTARIGRRLAEVHKYSAIGRPSRPLDQEIAGQKPLPRAVRSHHTDVERAALDFGEGDQIAARRPHRGAVFTRAKADSLSLAAIRIHHIELLRTAPIGVED